MKNYDMIRDRHSLHLMLEAFYERDYNKVSRVWQNLDHVPDTEPQFNYPYDQSFDDMLEDFDLIESKRTEMIAHLRAMANQAAVDAANFNLDPLMSNRISDSGMVQEVQVNFHVTLSVLASTETGRVADYVLSKKEKIDDLFADLSALPDCGLLKIEADFKEEAEIYETEAQAGDMGF